jgi:hypothetical protein
MRPIQISSAVSMLIFLSASSYALATPSVVLNASLKPERLGTRTTVQFGFTVTTGVSVPPPLIDVQLSLPANLGIATSGLGVAGCQLPVLEADGPPGCSPNSVIGYGSALAEVPFGPEILSETARIVILMAPIQGQQIKMLFFAAGESPVATSVVLPAEILPAAPPFGGILDTHLPLVPTLPEAPDAAIVKLKSTLGPAGITYYEYSRHSYIPYHPQGILLPKSCPPGGFRFAATFEFEDLTRASSNTTVPCPPSPTRRRPVSLARHHHKRWFAPARRSLGLPWPRRNVLGRRQVFYHR